MIPEKCYEDLLVQRNQASSGARGTCSEITFALSTCMDCFLQLKMLYNLKKA